MRSLHIFRTMKIINGSAEGESGKWRVEEKRSDVGYPRQSGPDLDESGRTEDRETESRTRIQKDGE